MEKRKRKGMWFNLSWDMFKLRSATRWTSSHLAESSGEGVRKIKGLGKPQLGSDQQPNEGNRRREKGKIFVTFLILTQKVNRSARVHPGLSK